MLDKNFLTLSLAISIGLVSISISNPHKSLINPNIVGGEEAIPHEFPFIVDLNYDRYHSCGGSIVHPKWILTAAHCTQRSLGNFSIVAGDHYLTVREKSEQRRQAIRIVNHPNYDSDLLTSDISLIEVDIPFIFNDTVQKVNLPTKDYEVSGAAVIIGWGKLSEDGAIIPSELRKANVSLVPNAACQAAYSDLPEDYDDQINIDDTMICAAAPGKDTCQGDSGGPMMCDGPSGPVQCGIVSFGLGCARAEYPGVYAKTSYFTDFIDDVIAGKYEGITISPPGGGTTEDSNPNNGVLNSSCIPVLIINCFYLLFRKY